MRNKKWIVAAVLIGVCLVVGGCSRFDAAAYTQAVLDAVYKNQTESYRELTEVSKEEAEAFFQNSLNATMEAFKSEKLSEELERNYRNLFESIMQQVKYTVGESKKEKDGSYTVKVSVEPVTLFDDTYQLFQQKAEEYAAGVTETVMKGAAMPTDEEIQEQVYKLYYEILKAELDAETKYGAPQKITLRVEKLADGDYKINREDLKILEEMLISRRVMSQEKS